jgi:ZIP family zinc transporter
MITLLIVLATAVSTTLGGLFAIKFRDSLHLILGISAGAVLGVALFDLLPEAIALAASVFGISLVTILIAVGFSAYMILDRLMSSHHCDDDLIHSRKGRLGASTLVFHSFLDGFAIGLSFQVSVAVGLIVAAAVLTHDFADGINTVNMIVKNKGERATALKWLAADALSPALGVVVASSLTVSGPILGLILSIFVGFFLFISASDLIPESHHRHPTIWTTLSTIIGMTIIFIAVTLAG